MKNPASFNIPKSNTWQIILNIFLHRTLASKFIFYLIVKLSTQFKAEDNAVIKAFASFNKYTEAK